MQSFINGNLLAIRIPNIPGWNDGNGVYLGNEAESNPYYGMYSANASGWGPTLQLGGWRGTIEAPEAPQDGDILGAFQVLTHNGTDAPLSLQTPFDFTVKAVGEPEEGYVQNKAILRTCYDDGVYTVTVTFSNGLVDFDCAVAVDSLRTKPCLVAQLPEPLPGMRAYVTDATSDLFGNEVVGGGAIDTPVVARLSGWTVG
jgi:hypothetical protein